MTEINLFAILGAAAVFIFAYEFIGILVSVSERRQDSAAEARGGLSDHESAIFSSTGLLPEDILRIKFIIAVVLGAITLGAVSFQISRSTGFLSFNLGIAALLMGVVLYASFVIPTKIVEFIHHRRMELMNQQLVDALNIITLSLRSGKTFEETLPIVSQQAPSPIREEFNRTAQEMKVGGLSLEAAMGRMADRLPFKDMKIFVSSLLIIISVGGSIADILQNSSDLIRQRFILKQKCKSMTAEGRFTALAISSAPPLILCVNLVINFDMSIVFITHPIGILVLVVIFISDYIGYQIINKLVQVEI